MAAAETAGDTATFSSAVPSTPRALPLETAAPRGVFDATAAARVLDARARADEFIKRRTRRLRPAPSGNEDLDGLPRALHDELCAWRAFLLASLEAVDREIAAAGSSVHPDPSPCVDTLATEDAFECGGHVLVSCAASFQAVRRLLQNAASRHNVRLKAFIFNRPLLLSKLGCAALRSGLDLDWVCHTGSGGVTSTEADELVLRSLCDCAGVPYENEDFQRLVNSVRQVVKHPIWTIHTSLALLCQRKRARFRVFTPSSELDRCGSLSTIFACDPRSAGAVSDAEIVAVFEHELTAYVECLAILASHNARGLLASADPTFQYVQAQLAAQDVGDGTVSEKSLSRQRQYLESLYSCRGSARDAGRRNGGATPPVRGAPENLMEADLLEGLLKLSLAALVASITECSPSGAASSFPPWAVSGSSRPISSSLWRWYENTFCCSSDTRQHLWAEYYETCETENHISFSEDDDWGCVLALEQARFILLMQLETALCGAMAASMAAESLAGQPLCPSLIATMHAHFISRMFAGVVGERVIAHGDGFLAAVHFADTSVLFRNLVRNHAVACAAALLAAHENRRMVGRAIESLSPADMLTILDALNSFGAPDGSGSINGERRSVADGDSDKSDLCSSAARLFEEHAALGASAVILSFTLFLARNGPRGDAEIAIAAGVETAVSRIPLMVEAYNRAAHGAVLSAVHDGTADPNILFLSAIGVEGTVAGDCPRQETKSSCIWDVEGVRPAGGVCGEGACSGWFDLYSAVPHGNWPLVVVSSTSEAIRASFFDFMSHFLRSTDISADEAFIAPLLDLLIRLTHFDSGLKTRWMLKIDAKGEFLLENALAAHLREMAGRQLEDTAHAAADSLWNTVVVSYLLRYMPYSFPVIATVLAAILSAGSRDVSADARALRYAVAVNLALENLNWFCTPPGPLDVCRPHLHSARSGRRPTHGLASCPQPPQIVDSNLDLSWEHLADHTGRGSGFPALEYRIFGAADLRQLLMPVYNLSLPLVDADLCEGASGCVTTMPIELPERFFLSARGSGGEKHRRRYNNFVWAGSGFTDALDAPQTSEQPIDGMSFMTADRWRRRGGSNSHTLAPAPPEMAPYTILWEIGGGGRDCRAKPTATSYRNARLSRLTLVSFTLCFMKSLVQSLTEDYKAVGVDQSARHRGETAEGRGEKRVAPAPSYDVETLMLRLNYLAACVSLLVSCLSADPNACVLIFGGASPETAAADLVILLVEIIPPVCATYQRVSTERPTADEVPLLRGTAETFSLVLRKLVISILNDAITGIMVATGTFNLRTLASMRSAQTIKDAIKARLVGAPSTTDARASGDGVFRQLSSCAATQPTAEAGLAIASWALRLAVEQGLLRFPAILSTFKRLHYRRPYSCEQSPWTRLLKALSQCLHASANPFAGWDHEAFLMQKRIIIEVASHAEQLIREDIALGVARRVAALAKAEPVKRHFGFMGELLNVILPTAFEIFSEETGGRGASKDADASMPPWHASACDAASAAVSLLQQLLEHIPRADIASGVDYGAFKSAAAVSAWRELRKLLRETAQPFIASLLTSTRMIVQVGERRSACGNPFLRFEPQSGREEVQRRVLVALRQAFPSNFAETGGRNLSLGIEVLEMSLRRPDVFPAVADALNQTVCFVPATFSWKFDCDDAWSSARSRLTLKAASFSSTDSSNQSSLGTWLADPVISLCMAFARPLTEATIDSTSLQSIIQILPRAFLSPGLLGTDGSIRDAWRSLYACEGMKQPSTSANKIVSTETSGDTWPTAAAKMLTTDQTVAPSSAVTVREATGELSRTLEGAVWGPCIFAEYKILSFTNPTNLLHWNVERCATTYTLSKKILKTLSVASAEPDEVEYDYKRSTVLKTSLGAAVEILLKLRDFQAKVLDEEQHGPRALEAFYGVATLAVDFWAAAVLVEKIEICTGTAACQLLPTSLLAGLFERGVEALLGINKVFDMDCRDAEAVGDYRHFVKRFFSQASVLFFLRALIRLSSIIILQFINVPGRAEQDAKPGPCSALAPAFRSLIDAVANSSLLPTVLFARGVGLVFQTATKVDLPPVRLCAHCTIAGFAVGCPDASLRDCAFERFHLEQSKARSQIRKTMWRDSKTSFVDSGIAVDFSSTLQEACEVCEAAAVAVDFRCFVHPLATNPCALQDPKTLAGSGKRTDVGSEVEEATPLTVDDVEIASAVALWTHSRKELLEALRCFLRAAQDSSMSTGGKVLEFKSTPLRNFLQPLIDLLPAILDGPSQFWSKPFMDATCLELVPSRFRRLGTIGGVATDLLIDIFTVNLVDDQSAVVPDARGPDAATASSPEARCMSFQLINSAVNSAEAGSALVLSPPFQWEALKSNNGLATQLNAPYISMDLLRTTMASNRNNELSNGNSLKSFPVADDASRPFGVPRLRLTAPAREAECSNVAAITAGSLGALLAACLRAIQRSLLAYLRCAVSQGADIMLTRGDGLCLNSSEGGVNSGTASDVISVTELPNLVTLFVIASRLLIATAPSASGGNSAELSIHSQRENGHTNHDCSGASRDGRDSIALEHDAAVSTNQRRVGTACGLGDILRELVRTLRLIVAAGVAPDHDWFEVAAEELSAARPPAERKRRLKLLHHGVPAWTVTIFAPVALTTMFHNILHCLRGRGFADHPALNSSLLPGDLIFHEHLLADFITGLALYGSRQHGPRNTPRLIKKSDEDARYAVQATIDLVCAQIVALLFSLAGLTPQMRKLLLERNIGAFFARVPAARLFAQSRRGSALPSMRALPRLRECFSGATDVYASNSPYYTALSRATAPCYVEVSRAHLGVSHVDSCTSSNFSSSVVNAGDREVRAGKLDFRRSAMHLSWCHMLLKAAHGMRFCDKEANDSSKSPISRRWLERGHVAAELLDESWGRLNHILVVLGNCNGSFTSPSGSPYGSPSELALWEELACFTQIATLLPKIDALISKKERLRTFSGLQRMLKVAVAFGNALLKRDRMDAIEFLRPIGALETYAADVRVGLRTAAQVPSIFFQRAIFLAARILIDIITAVENVFQDLARHNSRPLVLALLCSTRQFGDGSSSNDGPDRDRRESFDLTETFGRTFPSLHKDFEAMLHDVVDAALLTLHFGDDLFKMHRPLFTVVEGNTCSPPALEISGSIVERHQLILPLSLNIRLQSLVPERSLSTASGGRIRSTSSSQESTSPGTAYIVEDARTPLGGSIRRSGDNFSAPGSARSTRRRISSPMLQHYAPDTLRRNHGGTTTQRNASGGGLRAVGAPAVVYATMMRINAIAEKIDDDCLQGLLPEAVSFPCFTRILRAITLRGTRVTVLLLKLLRVLQNEALHVGATAARRTLDLVRAVEHSKYWRSKHRQFFELKKIVATVSGDQVF